MISRVLVFAVLLGFATPSDADSGRLCIVPVPKPNSEPKSLANPSGGNPDYEYSVKVGDRERIVISRTVGTLVDGLDPTAKHPIIIYEDGSRAASFYLDFTGGELSQCMFFRSLYLTWDVWPMSRTRGWCDCEGN